MAGEEDSNMKYCSNCKRDIATVNFVMHEVHCHKNIVLCTKCNEPVARSEQESHDLEEHAVVNCELCKAAFERRALEEHKTKCPKRPSVCPYCELECVQDELASHMDYCGSRTDVCDKCLQYVMHKDFAKHHESNCNYPEPKTTAAIQHAAERVVGEEDLYHDYHGSGGTRMNSFVRGELGRLGHEPSDPVTSPADRQDNTNVGVERSVRYGRSQRVTESQLRNPTRPKKTTNLSRGGRANQNKRKVDHKTIPDYRITNTEYLESASSTSGMDHALAVQLAAGLDVTGDLGLDDDDIANHMLAENLVAAEQPVRGNPIASGSDSSSGPSQPTPVRIKGTSPDAKDVVMLPCENCGDNFPLSLLIEHQNQCSEAEVASSGPLSSAVNQSALNNATGRVSPSGVRGQPAVIDNLNGREGHFASGPLNDYGNQSENWFPCEFCDESFPEDILLQHQPVCDRNPYQTPRVMTPKVPNRSVDPAHPLPSPTTTGSAYQRSRNSPSNSERRSKGLKKVPNTSTMPDQRRIESSSKSNRILNDFRANPSYSPLQLHGNQEQHRASPSNPSSHGYKGKLNRNGDVYHGYSSSTYKPSFSSGSSLHSQNSCPRLIPRSTSDNSELGASGASIRRDTTKNNPGYNSRGRNVKGKRPPRDV